MEHRTNAYVGQNTRQTVQPGEMVFSARLHCFHIMPGDLSAALSAGCYLAAGVAGTAGVAGIAGVAGVACVAGLAGVAGVAGLAGVAGPLALPCFWAPLLPAPPCLMLLSLVWVMVEDIWWLPPAPPRPPPMSPPLANAWPAMDRAAIAVTAKSVVVFFISCFLLLPSSAFVDRNLCLKSRIGFKGKGCI